ncbi:MAG TPA: ABC transporter substrate-binding protein [Bradyrhizobium sp.]|nr:ABC transporter substrate-binding protein [Bradyrhizobium sp.]
MRLAVVGAFATALLIQSAMPARAADPLKIGVLMETSGVFAVLGQRQLKGMQFAVEEAGGEVAGRKIELLHEDNEGKPDVGLAKARKLVLSDRVDVMSGIINSAVALAVAPYLSSQRMPIVLSNAASDVLSGAKCDRYVFRVSYSSSQISEPIGWWMAKHAPKNIYILGSDFVAGHEFVAAAKRGYLGGGGTIVGETFTPFGRTQDYGPYISQARSANPGAVFAVYFAAEALLFVKQYESFGMKATIPLIGPIGLTPPVLRQGQGDAALGVISPQNYVMELETPENRKFREAFKKKFNEDPEEFAVMGYDAIRFIIEAVKARGGDTKDRPALVQAIENVAYTGPRGPMKMAKNHQATQNVYIVKTVKKGNAVAFDIIDTYPNVEDPVKGCNLN